MDLFINILKDAGLTIIISVLLYNIQMNDKYSPYRLLIAVFLFFI